MLLLLSSKSVSYFFPFVSSLEHYDACSRKDLAESKKKVMQNMFAFLQHNTGDNQNANGSGSIEKANDAVHVVDSNSHKDENDISDPDLQMWLAPSFPL